MNVFTGRKLSRRKLCVLAVATLLIPRNTARANGFHVSQDARGVAIDGYDCTSYWQLEAPEEGVAAYAAEWHGVIWHFASALNAAQFSAAPDTLAPHFGGFCTRAMSSGKLVNGDPEVWRIYEGKLYLFARPVGGTKFDEEPGTMIAKAQIYWDSLN